MKGIEYGPPRPSGGTATGPLPGAWNATVAHNRLQPGTAVPISDGSLTLYSRRTITGTFVDGGVPDQQAHRGCRPTVQRHRHCGLRRDTGTFPRDGYGRPPEVEEGVHPTDSRSAWIHRRMWVLIVS
jgi:hypothetical protein